MTTPLGELTIGPRDGRRISLARSTRETTITITLGLDGTGSTSVDTGVGFYDHLLGSLAHHGLFDLAINADGDLQVDEHHTVEDVALVLGAAFAEALGDRDGIARFGQSAVPMDESIATATVDVGGRPYAVIDLPFRGERVGGLPLQLVEHALEAFARTAGVTLHLSGTGRNDHHLAEAAFKALGRALCASPASRIRAATASLRRRARSGEPAAADRRGRLRGRQPGQHRPGADDRRRRCSDRPRRRGLPWRRRRRRPGCRCRRSGDGPPRSARPDAADPRLARRGSPVPGHLPGTPAPVRGERRGRRDDPRRAARSNGPARGRPDPPAHRLEPGRADAPPPAVRRHRRRRRLLFRPLVRRVARRSRRRRRAGPDDHGRPFTSAVARGSLLGVQFHPERSGPDGLRLLRNFVELVRAA